MGCFVARIWLNFIVFAGKFLYRVTEESLMDRLTTDTHAACLLIHQDCRSEIAEYFNST